MKKILILLIALPMGMVGQEKQKKNKKFSLRFMATVKCVKKELKKRRSL